MPASRTVYLRDATTAGLEAKLEELGASRAGKNLDGSRWRIVVTSDDAVVEIQVLEDVGGWQMELSIESLHEWRSPFSDQGWEPTIAAMLLYDGSPAAASAASELARGILASLAGVAGEELT